MKKDSLKKLGILGVSFGLMASPLAFAGAETQGEYEPTPQEETMQDDQSTFNSPEVAPGADYEQDTTTEFEEEEQEFTYEEEEEEEDQWETEEEENTAGW